MQQRTIFFRADATPKIGAGHVMRSMALALQARKRGFMVYMYGRIHIPWLKTRITTEGIPFTDIESPLPLRENVQEFFKTLPNVPSKLAWFVLDGYHFGIECQKAVCEAGYRLLVIDDNCHLMDYCCDILLNQNLGAEKFAYKGKIGVQCLGVEYLLLRPEFLDNRHYALDRIFPSTPSKILLTLGGGSFFSIIEQIAPVLLIPEMQGKKLYILAPENAVEPINALFACGMFEVEVLDVVDKISNLFLNIDLCITAGGSTCWELLYFNIPFLTVMTADNQKNTVDSLQSIVGVKQLSVQSLLEQLSSLKCPKSLELKIDTRTIDVILAFS